jgi:23S rRNA (cytidine1920-2'-O)/16S rRNA (cytidine1409-2'-O)-methyltransferase
MKQRLDTAMVQRKLVESRSQAESWIRMGRVKVDGRDVKKAGTMVNDETRVTLDAPERYVSRAGLKLASVAEEFGLEFADSTVLDVGSSTGGFTDYALQHGAKKVIAVDVGTDQLHPSLRKNQRVELHEKTDIRGFVPSHVPDIVVIDVSFVSLRQILPDVASMSGPATRIVAMVKPQFEAQRSELTRGGIVKNDRIRRDILRAFELWSRGYFVIEAKADSAVAGTHGNRERFYVLRKAKKQ